MSLTLLLYLLSHWTSAKYAPLLVSGTSLGVLFCHFSTVPTTLPSPHGLVGWKLVSISLFILQSILPSNWAVSAPPLPATFPILLRKIFLFSHLRALVVNTQSPHWPKYICVFVSYNLNNSWNKNIFCRLLCYQMNFT